MEKNCKFYNKFQDDLKIGIIWVPHQKTKDWNLRINYSLFGKSEQSNLQLKSYSSFFRYGAYLKIGTIIQNLCLLNDEDFYNLKVNSD